MFPLLVTFLIVIGIGWLVYRPFVVAEAESLQEIESSNAASLELAYAGLEEIEHDLLSGRIQTADYQRQRQDFLKQIKSPSTVKKDS